MHSPDEADAAPGPAKVVTLLAELSKGNEHALTELMPLVYAELRRVAAYYLGRERGSHTLQPTALVHEAYLRLIGQKHAHWENKEQFVRVASQLMRRILVDYSRGRHAEKRGGHSGRVFLKEELLAEKGKATEVMALDDALNRLAELDPQQARLVELRFFGGLSIEETAGVLGIAPATVKRHWNVAKAWLARELQSSPGSV